MICFETKYNKLYNYIIQKFLEIEVFDVLDIDIAEFIETIVPKYLYREQYKNCEKKFKELYFWSKDQFPHRMTAFHELLLYNFLDNLSEVQRDMESFNEIYFDETARKLIDEAAKEEYEETDSDFTIEQLKEQFFDIYYYADELFFDTDFLMIDQLYSLRELGITEIENKLGINIDYYFELLPMDIQEKYKSHNITMTGEISSFLNYLQHKIYYGSLSKLFWDNDKQIKEEKIQVILENLMDAYFYKQGVEITREALVGTGKIDFKIFKNSDENEKVLIEVKKANNTKIKEGYGRQLTEYLKASEYKNSFYLIVCFTDDEYDKVDKFIKNYVYTNEYQLYINIFILDVRKKISASKSLPKKVA